MDSDERLRQRESQASPYDAVARGRLALAQARRGEGIRDVEPDALQRVLTAPWVSTSSWAAVRVGFKTVCIVRPGLLQQVAGWMPWMSLNIKPGATGPIGPGIDDSKVVSDSYKARLLASQPVTPCLVGRAMLDPTGPNARWRVSQWSVAGLNRFNEGLLRWCDGDLTTKHGGRRSILARNGLPRPARGVTPEQGEEPKVTTRKAELWSLEHVRLACGLDPVATESDVGSAPGGTWLKPRNYRTCDRCRSVEGMVRASGDALCYQCNVEGNGRLR